MPGRDDYILRYLDLIRQFLTQAIKLRDKGSPEQALQILLQGQEKLFARPAPEFIGLSLDEQLRLLTIGETAENSRAKRLAYAMLLREAGNIYRERDRSDLAESAFQLALHVLLTVTIETPAESSPQIESIRELVSQIPPEQLQAPVKEMLQLLGELLPRAE